MKAKKLLALLLCLTLCLGLLPVSALATLEPGNTSAKKSWVTLPTAAELGGVTQTAKLYPELGAAPDALIASARNDGTEMAVSQLVYISSPISASATQNVLGIVPNDQGFTTTNVAAVKLHVPEEYTYTNANNEKVVDMAVLNGEANSTITYLDENATSTIDWVFGVPEGRSFMSVTWKAHEAAGGSTASTAKADATDWYEIFVATSAVRHIAIDPALDGKITISAEAGSGATAPILLGEGLAYGLTVASGSYTITATAADGYKITAMKITDGDTDVAMTPSAYGHTAANGTALEPAADKTYTVTGTVEKVGTATIGLDSTLSGLTGVDYEVSIADANSYSKLTELTDGVKYDVRLTIAEANAAAYNTSDITTTVTNDSTSVSASETDNLTVTDGNPSKSKEVEITASAGVNYTISATGLVKSGVAMTVKTSDGADNDMAFAASGTTAKTYTLKLDGTDAVVNAGTVTVSPGNVLTISPNTTTGYAVKAVTYSAGSPASVAASGTPNADGTWKLIVPAVGAGTLKVESAASGKITFADDSATHDIGVVNAYVVYDGKTPVAITSGSLTDATAGTELAQGSTVYLVVKVKAGVTPNLTATGATFSDATATTTDPAKAVKALHTSYFPDEADASATYQYKLLSFTMPATTNLLIVNGGDETAGTTITIADTGAAAGVITVYYGDGKTTNAGTTKAVNTMDSAATNGTATLVVPQNATVYVKANGTNVIKSLSVTDGTSELAAAAGKVTVDTATGLFSFNSGSNATMTVTATVASAGYTVATPTAASGSGVTVKGVYLAGKATPKLIPGSDTVAALNSGYKLPEQANIYVALELPLGVVPKFTSTPAGSLTNPTDATSGDGADVYAAVWPARDADGKTITYSTTVNRVVYQLTLPAAANAKNVTAVEVGTQASANKLLVKNDKGDKSSLPITVTYKDGEDDITVGNANATLTNFTDADAKAALEASTATVPYGATVTIAPSAAMIANAAENVIAGIELYKVSGSGLAIIDDATELAAYKITKTGENFTFVMQNEDVLVKVKLEDGVIVTLDAAQTLVTADDLYLVDVTSGTITGIVGKVVPKAGTVAGVKVAKTATVAVIAKNASATITAVKTADAADLTPAVYPAAADPADPDADLANLKAFIKLVDTFNGATEATDATALVVSTFTPSAAATVGATVAANGITLTKLNDTSYDDSVYGYSVTVGETTVAAKPGEDVVAFNTGAKVAVGTTVTITTRQTAGTKAVLSVDAYDGSNAAVKVVNTAENTYTFKMPSTAAKVVVNFGETVSATATVADKTGAVTFATGVAEASGALTNLGGGAYNTLAAFGADEAVAVAKLATLLNTNTVTANKVRTYVWADESVTVNFTVGEKVYSTSTTVTDAGVTLNRGADALAAYKTDVTALITEEIATAYLSGATVAARQAIIDGWNDKLAAYGLGIADLDTYTSPATEGPLTTALKNYGASDLTLTGSFGGASAPKGVFVELELSNIAAATTISVDAVIESYKLTLKNVTPALASGETVTVTYEGADEDFDLGLTSFNAATDQVTASIPAGTTVTVTFTTTKNITTDSVKYGAVADIGTGNNYEKATVSKTNDKVYTFTMPAADTGIIFGLTPTYALSFTTATTPFSATNLAGIVGVYTAKADGTLNQLTTGALLENPTTIYIITDHYEYAENLTITGADAYANGEVGVIATTDAASPVGKTSLATTAYTDTSDAAYDAIQAIVGDSETMQVFTATTNQVANTVIAVGVQADKTLKLTQTSPINSSFKAKIGTSTYTPSVGTATLHPGDTVVITMEPADGYAVSSVVLDPDTAASADVLPVSVEGNVYTFVMPNDGATVTVTDAAAYPISLGASAEDAAISAKSFYTYTALADKSYTAAAVTVDTTVVGYLRHVVALVEADAGRAPTFTHGEGASPSAVTSTKITDEKLIAAVKAAAEANGYTVTDKTAYYEFEMANAAMTINTGSRDAKGTLRFAWTPAAGGSYTVTDGTKTVDTSKDFDVDLVASQLKDVNADTEITVKTTPAEGYAVKEILFLNASNATQTVEVTTVTRNSEYSFLMPDTLGTSWTMRVVFEKGYTVKNGAADATSKTGLPGAVIKGVYIADGEGYAALAESTVIPAGTTVYAVVSKPAYYTLANANKALKNGTTALDTEQMAYSKTETSDYAKLVKLAGLTGDASTVLVYSFSVAAATELTVNATETLYTYTRTGGKNLAANTQFLYVKSFNADGTIKELGALSDGAKADLEVGTPIYVVINATDGEVAANEVVGIVSKYTVTTANDTSITAETLADAATLAVLNSQSSVKTLLDNSKTLMYYSFEMPAYATVLDSVTAATVTKVEITDVEVNLEKATAEVKGTRVGYQERAEIELTLTGAGVSWKLEITDENVTRTVSFGSTVNLKDAEGNTYTATVVDEKTITFATGEQTTVITDGTANPDASAAELTGEIAGDTLTVSATDAVVALSVVDGGYKALEKGETRNTFVVDGTETEIVLVRLGDVSGDGLIDGDDATLILRHDVGMVTLEGIALAAAKVAGADEVTGDDATLILRYDVGLITEFPW